MLEMKRESMRRELAFARLRQGRSYRWSWRHMPSNREAPNTNKKREQKKRESEKGKRVRREKAWTTSYTSPLISCLVNSHFILQVGPIMPPQYFQCPFSWQAHATPLTRGSMIFGSVSCFVSHKHSQETDGFSGHLMSNLLSSFQHQFKGSFHFRDISE